MDDLRQKILNATKRPNTQEHRVTFIEGANVPGYVVFITDAKLGSGRRTVAARGIAAVSGDEIITDAPQAMKRIAQVWKYGPSRTVPPDQVALVMGQFCTAVERCYPMVGDKDLASASRYQGRLFLPREATVDGAPAVEFFNSSPDQGVWLNTVTFHPDGNVTMTSKEDF